MQPGGRTRASLKQSLGIGVGLNDELRPTDRLNDLNQVLLCLRSDG